MKCSLLPIGATTINDALKLHEPMTMLMKEARREDSEFKVRIDGHCDYCGIYCKLENHHITPVWVYALRKCIDANLRTFKDLRKFLADVFCGKVTISECNSSDNLVRLCKECHQNTDNRTYAEWCRYFEANYPNLFLGTRRTPKMLEWLASTD